ncbi:MAG TPA: hypothetical protein VFO55_01855 [Gemmatimonadaceae bacterium]|nr:hypothetical protein [Gemmatimonadaceae bacterium]
MLGESDLGFVQVFENLRAGWFHPSPAGEKFMRVLTGTGPALMTLSKMMRDPVAELARGLDSDPDAEFPRDIRLTTQYADLVSIVDELEAMQLELRDADGTVVETETIGIDDTEWKVTLIPRRLRRKIDRTDGPEPWQPGSPPVPRYQIQVRLRGVPRRRLHVPGLGD